MIEENEKGRKYPEPVSVDTIMAYMTYLSEPPEKYAVPAQGPAEQLTLTGRGLAFPSVRAAMWAIGSVHEDMGFTNPTAVRVIKRRLDEMGRKHVANGAPAYDIVEVRIGAAQRIYSFPISSVLTRAPPPGAQGVRQVRTAIFEDEYEGRKNPFSSGFQRVQIWTMFMLQNAMVGRASLLTDYCPHVEQLELPTDPKRFGLDGVPEWILFHLKQWKGNADRVKKQAR
jgi:hypothetical protein